MDYASKVVKPHRLVKRSILLKGPSGSGKSFQFRKLAEGEMKGLYACVNEHTGTVEDLNPDTWFINTYDIPLTISAKRPEQQDFVALMDYMRSDQHDYDFLFFDSLFSFAEELEHYLRYEHRPQLTGFDLWRMFGEKMKRAIKILVSLTEPKHPRPVHVIATWGVGIGRDWEGNRAVEPLVSGNMVGPRISYYFDDVFMLRKQESADKGVEYLLYTGGTHEFDAKVSSGNVKLPAIIADPDLFRILRKIEAEQIA